MQSPQRLPSSLHRGHLPPYPHKRKPVLSSSVEYQEARRHWLLGRAKKYDTGAADRKE